MGQKILLVEDEIDIKELMKIQLQSQGYDVLDFTNGSEALEYIQNNIDVKNIDLFILDRMLPGTSGSDLCKFIRMYKETKTTPVLMVTAMTKPEDVVEGLDAGADDYVTKPFDNEILFARIRSLLRRAEIIGQNLKEDEKTTYEIQGIKLDSNQCKVWIDQEESDLTLSEYKLLYTFMKSPGKVFTRNQLVEEIQDGPVHVTDRTIDTHIFGLRKKLKSYSSFIETIRGVGYRVKGDGK